MQSIIVKFHGPTETRGSRYIARCDGGSVVMPADHSMNPEGNSDAAARLLMRKLGWHEGSCEVSTLWARGYLNGDAVYTLVNRTTTLKGKP